MPSYGPVSRPAPIRPRAARSDQEAFIWGLFLSLALIWGSSFLFIKIGLDAGMAPFTLVTWRMAMASLFLVVVLRFSRGRVPRAPGSFRRLTILALFNVAVPALLISWGEQSISSALTSVLNGLNPLFTIVIAALVLRDEPITLNRLAGLLIGFGGAALIASPNIGQSGSGVSATAALLGELAVALGALSYAVGAVYARHRITGHALVDDPDAGLRQASPVEIALPQAAISGVFCGIFALLFERPADGLLALPPDATAWFAVTWLGMLGSGLAYLLFFRLVRAWGATRTTMVTYAMPIVGISLGFMVLREQLHPIEIVGSVLVLAGLILANSSVGRRVLFQRRTPAPSPEPDI
jgi:drug/metabolite transporter (DMT)-like permease